MFLSQYWLLLPYLFPITLNRPCSTFTKPFPFLKTVDIHCGPNSQPLFYTTTRNTCSCLYTPKQLWTIKQSDGDHQNSFSSITGFLSTLKQVKRIPHKTPPIKSLVCVVHTNGNSGIYVKQHNTCVISIVYCPMFCKTQEARHVV